MKSALLVSSSALLLAMAACSPEAVAPVGGTGGSSSGTGGSSSGSGGSSSGSGGSSSGSGGSSSGSGGSSSGTGGSSSGTGGSSSGTGGSSSGTGGSSSGTGGGSSGTGGSSSGTGGSVGGNTGSGGSATGGGTGTGGSTTGSGGATAVLPTVMELFPSGTDGALDGRLVTTPCGENSTTNDCSSAGAYYRSALTTCSGGALNIMHTYPVAGTSGKTYKVTMHFYGIVEPKNYGSAVTREASARPGNQNTGASPTPWATAAAGHTYPSSTYNTYEIHVDNASKTEVAVYYLNADTSEGHYTYVLNYEKEISVIGGGQIRIRTFDSNCRQIKNCGSTTSTPCGDKANQRIINVSAANPAPATTPANQGGLSQPGLIATRDATQAGQWLLLDVVSVNSSN